MKPTKEHAIKILEVLQHGLTKGLGIQELGKMCVKVVINCVLELPHGDNPPCIGEEVRRVKISLNDCIWSSNKARADGMRKLAIAQLGSDILNQKEFEEKLKLASTKRILPYLIQKHYEKIKDEKLIEYKLKFESLDVLDNNLWTEFYNYHNYYNYDFYNYNYYYNDHYYNYHHYNNHHEDKFLLVITDTILSVLIDMKSPGCEWLDLIPPLDK